MLRYIIRHILGVFRSIIDGIIVSDVCEFSFSNWLVQPAALLSRCCFILSNFMPGQGLKPKCFILNKVGANSVQEFKLFFCNI